MGQEGCILLGFGQIKESWHKSANSKNIPTEFSFFLNINVQKGWKLELCDATEMLWTNKSTRWRMCRKCKHKQFDQVQMKCCPGCCQELPGSLLGLLVLLFSLSVVSVLLTCWSLPGPEQTHITKGPHKAHNMCEQSLLFLFLFFLGGAAYFRIESAVWTLRLGTDFSIWPSEPVFWSLSYNCIYFPGSSICDCPFRFWSDWTPLSLFLLSSSVSLWRS